LKRGHVSQGDEGDPIRVGPSPEVFGREYDHQPGPVPPRQMEDPIEIGSLEVLQLRADPGRDDGRICLRVEIHPEIVFDVVVGELKQQQWGFEGGDDGFGQFPVVGRSRPPPGEIHEPLPAQLGEPARPDFFVVQSDRYGMGVSQDHAVDGIPVPDSVQAVSMLARRKTEGPCPETHMEVGIIREITAMRFGAGGDLVQRTVGDAFPRESVISPFPQDVADKRGTVGHEENLAREKDEDRGEEGEGETEEEEGETREDPAGLQERFEPEK